MNQAKLTLRQKIKIHACYFGVCLGSLTPNFLQLEWVSAIPGMAFTGILSGLLFFFGQKDSFVRYHALNVIAGSTGYVTIWVAGMFLVLEALFGNLGEDPNPGVAIAIIGVLEMVSVIAILAGVVGLVYFWQRAAVGQKPRICWIGRWLEQRAYRGENFR